MAHLPVRVRKTLGIQRGLGLRLRPRRHSMFGLGNFHLIPQDSEMCGVLSPNLAFCLEFVGCSLSQGALQSRSLAPERQMPPESLGKDFTLGSSCCLHIELHRRFASPCQLFPVD